jgi:hypothetical protein
MAVAIINATIWLEVRQDANIPTDTKADPNKIKPRYEVNVAPSSTIPTGFPR